MEWVAIGVFASFVVVLALPPVHRNSDALKRRVCQVRMRQVAGATQGFIARFGEPPKGTMEEILQVLCGQNAKQMRFLDLGAQSQDEKGSFVDPWRTPYQIGTNQTNGLSIRSAGPNRRFGDADDLEQSLEIGKPPTRH